MNRVDKLREDLNRLLTWHRKFITIDDNGVITTWDESGAGEISNTCTSIRQAVRELNNYAETL